MDNSWFALRVKSRREKSVADFATNAGFAAFAPVTKVKRRWSQRIQEVELPLFAGYMFCAFNRADYARVMNIPGVVDVVRSGKALAPVNSDEVSALRRVEDPSCTIEPCDYLPVGQRIWITHGPLADLQGIVLEDRGRVDLVLSITLLQRSVRVTLPRDLVSLTDAQHADLIVRPSLGKVPSVSL